jgi:hypothetical protein
MKERTPAWVGSVAADVRDIAVKAWSMVLAGIDHPIAICAEVAVFPMKKQGRRP